MKKDKKTDMSRCTPGPWRYEPGASTIFGGPEGQYRVAEVDMGRICDSNARLIAAAPDLLATLRRLHEAIKPYDVGHEGSELLEVMCEAQCLLDDLMKGQS